ncbi:putative inorganic phosphate cotransporter [Parasteatoda tepidariorum]|uniref:putative inorganic phosphate cotransporter n=1 Tax=Parasteatoda tepidariorum TaxID=114398 RepID=UPI0039BD5359
MVGHNFGYLMLMTELPTYLSTILHFNLAANGLLSALPFILQLFVSWIASWAADKLRKANKFSITVIRKLFNTIGMTAPAICLLAVTQLGCQPELIVVLFTIGLGIDGCIFSGYNITPVDMTPNFSGMTAPAICLLAVTQLGCQPELIVVLFTIGLGIDGCIFSGYNITPVDMTPNFSDNATYFRNILGEAS